MRAQTPNEKTKKESASQNHSGGCRAHAARAANGSYFAPKFADEEERSWGDDEKKALLRGLEQHGVGAWDAIRKDLPQWVRAEALQWGPFCWIA